MFRFWYRFVPENNSIIARGAVELAYRRIEPHLSDYMGHIFEDICSQYLWALLLKGKARLIFGAGTLVGNRSAYQKPDGDRHYGRAGSAGSFVWRMQMDE